MVNEKDAFLSTASLVIGDGVTQDGQEVGMMIVEKESLSISPPARLYRRMCWKINLMSSPELEQEFPQHLQITTRRIDSRMVPPAISVGTGDGSRQISLRNLDASNQGPFPSQIANWVHSASHGGAQTAGCVGLYVGVFSDH